MLKQGDVIFSRGRSKQSAVSRFIQGHIDPLAKGALQSFSHVSIVLDSFCAVEAVPVESMNSDGTITQEMGQRSGMPLGYGVRMLTLADLLGPLWDDGAPVAVLRPRHFTQNASQVVTLCSRQVAGSVGMEYSIDQLKRTAESYLGFMLPRTVKTHLFPWSSPPGGPFYGNEDRSGVSRQACE
jgi:hypothetical protein